MYTLVQVLKIKCKEHEKTLLVSWLFRLVRVWKLLKMFSTFSNLMILKKNFWYFLSPNSTVMIMFSFWVTKYYIAQLIMNVKCFQQPMVWYNLRICLDFMEITSKLRILCKALRWSKPRLTQNIGTRANATNIKVILLKKC